MPTIKRSPSALEKLRKRFGIKKKTKPKGPVGPVAVKVRKKPARPSKEHVWDEKRNRWIRPEKPKTREDEERAMAAKGMVPAARDPNTGEVIAWVKKERKV